MANKSNHKGDPLPCSLHQIEETQQIKFIHTIIRNRDTPRDEFIFYSNRLMRILIEYALSLLPFEDVTVQTTGSLQYEGKRHANAKVYILFIISNFSLRFYKCNNLKGLWCFNSKSWRVFGTSLM